MPILGRKKIYGLEVDSEENTIYWVELGKDSKTVVVLDIIDFYLSYRRYYIDTVWAQVENLSKYFRKRPLGCRLV